MKNNIILTDFRETIINQFIGVITYGFGVTSFFSAINIYINTNTISLSTKDFIFIFCSFVGYFLSCYILKDSSSFKIKILKSLDFVITILGFVLMFVPLILFCQNILDTNYIFEYIVIQNSIISFITSIVIFLIKSILKHFIKTFLI